MRELRESESSINSLHRRLSSLSRVLAEAREVLDSKQDVVDVEEYLKKCEVSGCGGGLEAKAEPGNIPLGGG